MKSKCAILSVALMACVAFTACHEYDDPDTHDFKITSETSIGTTNSTIYQVKKLFEMTISAQNQFVKVEEDIIFEGVVCANDAGGNLYQTVMIRDIDETKSPDDEGYDQSISLGIKNTFVSPYFPLGQRIKVNLKGLYIGNYSKTPKVGQPYYTSAGNLRIGPMLLQYCKTNIELVGTPNPSAPELIPIDLTGAEGDAWLRAGDNKTIFNTPLLATVEGTIRQAKTNAEVGVKSGLQERVPKIFAPEALYDDGYAVNRTLQLLTNNTTLDIRTSTQNDVAFLLLPSDARKYTGMLSYYSNWQMQMRSVEDVERYEELLVPTTEN